jgi:hypothetical protein
LLLCCYNAQPIPDTNARYGPVRLFAYLVFLTPLGVIVRFPHLLRRKEIGLCRMRQPLPAADR